MNTVITVNPGLQSQHQTVLETLEQKKCAPQSQCRNGFCGCCRTKLIKGEVQYTAEPIGFHGEGEILPCVCTAVGDIELEVVCS